MLPRQTPTWPCVWMTLLLRTLTSCCCSESGPYDAGNPHRRWLAVCWQKGQRGCPSDHVAFLVGTGKMTSVAPEQQRGFPHCVHVCEGIGRTHMVPHPNSPRCHTPIHPGATPQFTQVPHPNSPRCHTPIHPGATPQFTQVPHPNSPRCHTPNLHGATPSTYMSHPLRSRATHIMPNLCHTPNSHGATPNSCATPTQTHNSHSATYPCHTPTDMVPLPTHVPHPPIPITHTVPHTLATPQLTWCHPPTHTVQLTWCVSPGPALPSATL